MESLTPDELRTAAFVAFQTFDKEKKDLNAYVLAGRTIIEAALALAANNPGQAAAYKGVAMATSYNVAAACWPGWEDAHADISDEHLATGLALSRFNIETAAALDAPPERRKNGYWILGAHLIANGSYDEARSAFETSGEFASRAGLKDASLVAEGWTLVCDLLSGDRRARDSLEKLKSELKGLGDDGKFFAGQFEPAIAVFSG